MLRNADCARVFATPGVVSIQPWTIQRGFPRPFATAAWRARIPEPLDSWRRFEDDPIGFPAPNKPLSRARRKFGHIRGWPPLLSLGYPNAHGARDLPDQA